ncbi:hypothetical protein Tsubulata_044062, partial [Turnera subulata]
VLKGHKHNNNNNKKKIIHMFATKEKKRIINIRVMGTVETPPPPLSKEELKEEEEEESPIEQVRLTVPNTDDTSLPVWTFRMTEPLVITQITVQVATLPIGRFMASVLPETKFQVPGFGGREFTLNPGPFNIKEHVLISIFANAGSAFGYGSAYAVSIVNIIKAFYGRNISFASSWILIITTQVLGYGWAGLLRKYVVEPAHMWWPSTLVQISLFRTLHEKEDKDEQRISRVKFFGIAMLCSFLWYLFPGYLFQTLQSIAWVCYVFPRSVTAHQIGSGMKGLGIGALTLDWSTVASFLGSPLLTPFFAIANVCIGYVLILYVVIPVSYWGLNTYDAKTFPIFSSHLFNAQGAVYNFTTIVNDKFEIDMAQYNKQGRVHLSTFFALTYGFGFATIAATLTHVALFYGREIYDRYRASAKGKEDIHTRLMKHYKDIPNWWFYVLLSGTLVVSLALCIFLKKEVQIPWWALIFAAALAFFFSLPISIITATTNQTPGLNIITEYVMGLIYPGKPIANVCFKTYGYMSMAQAISFLSDFKLGHYMKIPPRSMFLVQFLGTMIAGTINLSVAWWLLGSIENICQDNLLPADSPWTCPGDRVFFDASIIWGLVGPKRIFGTLGEYSALNWFFLGGLLGPCVVWLLHKAFPSQSWIPLINLPVLLGATAAMPPATAINYNSWILVGTIFNFFIFRYRKNWWKRYNYVLSAALDAGVAFMAVVLYVTVGLENKNLSWWGSNPDKNHWKKITYYPSLCLSMGTVEIEVPPTHHIEEDDEQSPIEQVRPTVPNTDNTSLLIWTFRMWFLGILYCCLLPFINQFFIYPHSAPGDHLDHHPGGNSPHRTVEAPGGGRKRKEDELVDDDDVSPVEEVRLTVSTEDDTTLPVYTFRMWFLGIISCVVLSFLNTFFSYRTEPLTISMISVLIATLPIGRFMAKTLPKTKFRLPGFGNREFSLNPGPFNVKEHVLISIFANVGSGTAYAISIIDIIMAFYRRRISFVASFLLVLTTQVLGYGWAGIMRRFVVDPAEMWWPSSLVQVSLFRALHEKDNRRMSRGKFFIIALVCSFSWYVVPGYFFPVLSMVSWVCWIFPKSVTGQQLGSGMNGLGLGSFAIDWAVIASYLGSPLITPFFAVVNIIVGYVVFMYIVLPIAYWKYNMYDAKTFPIFSSDLYNPKGQMYDVHAIVNDKFEIDLPAYQQQGHIQLSSYFALSYGIGFASIMATLTHQPGLNIITEYIMGIIYPGRPIANVCFKTYGYISMAQAISFLSDFKLGHYMKIPPRSMFLVQCIGTVIAGTVQVAVAWWMLTGIDNICNKKLLPPNSPWTCPGDRVFYDASVIWGLVGPRRIFGSDGKYSALNWFFLGGVLGPLVIWCLHKAFPGKKWIPLINLPVLLGATAIMPPATTVNFNCWIVLAVVFNYFIFKHHKNWWQRYNYVLSAALDAGLAFMGVLLYFSLTMQNINITWWGSDSEHCPLATCPTAKGMLK